MKLLFAIKSLNVVGGGAERVLVTIANGLAARGHCVKILTFDCVASSFYDLCEQVERIDIGIGKPGTPTPRIGFLFSIRRLRNALLAESADLIIPFMHSTLIPVWLSLLGTSEKIIFSEHVESKHYADRFLQRAMLRIAEKFVIAKTVPTRRMLPDVEDPMHATTFLMPNPVCRPSVVSTENVIDSTIVLSVGRFMKEKNHIELLQAFGSIADEFPQWTLRMVGEGVLRAEIEVEIKRRGLCNRVELPGATKQIGDEYMKCAFVVLPSLYESFGLVAAEALASGRPVVAFDDCAGLAEMVRHGENGLLAVSSGDRVANLAMSMKSLMESSELRSELSGQSIESVSHLSEEFIVAMWERLLFEISGSEI